MKNYLIILLSLFFVCCNSKSEREQEIDKIPIDLAIQRFDLELGTAIESDLPHLKNKYPAFFPEQFPDSVWVAQLTDTLQIELNDEVAKKYPDTDLFEDDLKGLFQHIKYYFSEFQSPQVITLTSYVDYQNKVIVANDTVLIALDTYLGSDHKFYEGIQKYISKNMNSSQIIPDVATAYAERFISFPKQKTLLSQMIFYGKQLYLKNLWLPNYTDAEKIGYTEEEIIWAKNNEIDIWRYFVQNEILYSTDPKLPSRFITPAPFTKFYLEIDNESPGMIGRYLGWQIVRSYMEKNDVGIKQLMMLDAETIFNESKYKPKKT